MNWFFQVLYKSVQTDNEKKPKKPWFSSKEKAYAKGGAAGGGLGAAGGGAAVYYGIIAAISNPFTIVVGIGGALGILVGLCFNLL